MEQLAGDAKVLQVCAGTDEIRLACLAHDLVEHLAATGAGSADAGLDLGEAVVEGVERGGQLVVGVC